MLSPRDDSRPAPDGPRKRYAAPSLDRVRLLMKQEQLAPNVDANSMCTFHSHDMTGSGGC